MRVNNDLVYAYEGNKGVELGVDQKDNFLGAYNRMPGKSLFPHPYGMDHTPLGKPSIPHLVNPTEIE